jgi:outer membrane protein assembly factor BamB
VRSSISAGIFLVVVVSSALAADWPQFLGPKRDGTSSETGLRTDFPRGGPPVVWEHDVGAGYSSPVIADGKLILFHRVGNDDVVQCLDAATGKELWRHAYATDYRDRLGKGDGPRATPVIDHGRVYTVGAQGHLLCLELSSGKKVWEHSLLKDYVIPASWFGVGSTPLVEGDLLLVNVGGEGAGVVAFNKTDGKEVWKATEQGASYSSPVAADIDGVRHALFLTRLGLLSLDPQKGTVRFHMRWRSRFDASVNAATPVVNGDQIFLSACYDTGAILLKATKSKVEEVWRSNDALLCHFGTPVLVSGHLYGFDGRQEEGARLRCIDWKTGKVNWTKDDFGCGSIVAASGMLIVLSEYGDLVLIEPTPTTYREKARAKVLSKPCRSNLALADGRLYARDGKKLVCWNLKK